MVDPGKSFEIGDKIVVSTTQHSGLTGQVKYIGSVKGTTGQWIGVALDTAQGKNNGTYSGRTYF